MPVVLAVHLHIWSGGTTFGPAMLSRVGSPGSRTHKRPRFISICPKFEIAPQSSPSSRPQTTPRSSAVPSLLLYRKTGAPLSPLSHLEVDHIGAQDIYSAFLPFVFAGFFYIPVGPSCLGSDLVQLGLPRFRGRLVVWVDGV